MQDHFFILLTQPIEEISEIPCKLLSGSQNLLFPNILKSLASFSRVAGYWNLEFLNKCVDDTEAHNWISYLMQKRINVY